jgi:hypothetical protein
LYSGKNYHKIFLIRSRQKEKKMRRIFLFALLVLSAGLLSACNFETEATPSPTPEVITIVVTATPEPATETPVPSETPVPTATPEPTATAVLPTATTGVVRFYVSGTVWHDACAPGLDGGTAPTPTALPSGCIATSSGGRSANGIFDAGEKGIAGVTVRVELDCSYGAFTTVTDANGYYSMSFTAPADSGVTQQRICLSVNVADNGALIPGGWTYPAGASGIALYDVVVPVEKENTYNFGWDYQFK